MIAGVPALGPNSGPSRRIESYGHAVWQSVQCVHADRNAVSSSAPGGRSHFRGGSSSRSVMAAAERPTTSHAETTLFVSVLPICEKNCLRENVMVSIDYMADVRISIGCFNSHRLNTLKQIIPTSMGNWLRNAARPVPNNLSDVRCATHRL